MSKSSCVTFITHAVNASMEAQAERNEAKVRAYALALELLNGDMPVTIDANGRLHAPCSGYQSECGHVYNKGQFIPVEGSEYQGTERNKVRVSGKDFIAALQADAELSRSLGTTWVNNNGTLQANLYLEIAKGEEELVLAVVRDIESNYTQEVAEHTLDGKVAVTGEVVGLWTRQSEYGTQFGFTVMVESGAVYKGTLPKSAADADEGDTITFTATFTEGSAYFKRPSKAKLAKGAAKAA